MPRASLIIGMRLIAIAIDSCYSKVSFSHEARRINAFRKYIMPLYVSHAKVDLATILFCCFSRQTRPRAKNIWIIGHPVVHCLFHRNWTPDLWDFGGDLISAVDEAERHEFPAGQSACR